MRTIAALAIAVLSTAMPAFAATDVAGIPNRGPMPAPIQSLDARNNDAIVPPVPPTERNDRRTYPRHGHRIVYVYVPVYVPVGAGYYPYYYAPAVPMYVDQDPPYYAYREPNGFYYWCPAPAGYYPDQQDCPIGWRLVAP